MIDGTLPEIKAGLLITPVGTEDAWVATDEVEFDRVGEAGR